MALSYFSTSDNIKMFAEDFSKTLNFSTQASICFPFYGGRHRSLIWLYGTLLSIIEKSASAFFICLILVIVTRIHHHYF